MSENPYPGINAHLNSWLQTPGTGDNPSTWHSFRAQHTVHILEYINQMLPHQYIGDLIVLPRSIVIRQLESRRKMGRVVARLELVAPSNKQGHRHYESYSIRRIEAIESGVLLIEIDYLHESPSPVQQLPVYPRDLGAFPFSIVVSDPRPNWSSGKVKFYGFRLHEPIKPFILPLGGDDQIAVDLNPIYQHTFKVGRWGEWLDYAQDPECFHTYHREDQKFIHSVMQKLSTDAL